MQLKDGSSSGDEVLKRVLLGLGKYNGGFLDEQGLYKAVSEAMIKHPEYMDEFIEEAHTHRDTMMTHIPTLDERLNFYQLAGVIQGNEIIAHRVRGIIETENERVEEIASEICRNILSQEDEV